MTTVNGTAPVSTTTLNLLALVPLVYAVPTFALYLTIIVVILQKFEEPFYRLFVVNGVIVSPRTSRREDASIAIVCTGLEHRTRISGSGSGPGALCTHECSNITGKRYGGFLHCFS